MIDYFYFCSLTILEKQTFMETNFPLKEVQTGRKRAPIQGVGINDAPYTVTALVDGKRIICPIYNKWSGLLQRCYCKAMLDRSPTYRECSVSEDWFKFSNFLKWAKETAISGWEIDKDILFPESKVYSAETCTWVPKNVNLFIVDRALHRGCSMLGTWRHPNGRYRATCNNPFTGKHDHLGFFDVEEEGHQAWKKRKQEYVNPLCDMYPELDPRVRVALLRRYE